jgi:hypothetical protein
MPHKPHPFTMMDLRPLDQRLDALLQEGVPALGHYAIDCLRYADAREQQQHERRWRKGDGDYSANEYLLGRIAEELAVHGFITKALNIPALVHRVEFANRIRSAVFRDIIRRNEQEHYREQFYDLLQSLSRESVPDLLTAAELCAGFADYTEGGIRLAQALNRLSTSTDEPFWWDGLVGILSAYPANEETFKLASSAWSLLKYSRQYAKYPICAFLALFEDKSPEIAQLLHELPQQPEPGALVSPHDLVMRGSASEWVKRGNPIKAVAQAQRVISPIDRQYALTDLSKYAQQLKKDERHEEAEQLEQALTQALGETVPRQEEPPSSPTSLEALGQSPGKRRIHAKTLVSKAIALGRRPQISKLEASEQTSILQELLALQEWPSARTVVRLLVNTLEQVPAFSKHEFRARDVAQLLEPYHDTHPKVVYEFVTDLLRRDSRKSYWQTVHGTSAVLSLMLSLGGVTPLMELAKFLSDWPQGEEGDGSM